MSSTASLPLDEVDERLGVLQQNLEALRAAAEECALSGPGDQPAEFMSVAQAFHDEGEVLRAARNGSRDDRYAALDHTLSNIATIRREADDHVVAALDDAVEGELESW